MQAGNVIQSVAYAVASAVTDDLLPHVQPVMQRVAGENGSPGNKVATGETRNVRPSEREIDVRVFSQTWGSSSLGFPGVGTQGLTSAYTTIVFGPQGDVCVYFERKLAYHIKKPTRKFYADMAQSKMAPVAEADDYEEEPVTAAEA